MKVDIVASQVQYVDHLAPVHHALGRHAGAFLVWGADIDRLVARVESHGIRPAVEATTGDAVLVASYRDHKWARRMRRPIVRMEHGIGQSFSTSRNPSYAGGQDARDVALFLTPNDHAAERWRRAYPGAPVVVVGSPKLDTLPVRIPGAGPVVATSFHWGRPRHPSHPLNEAYGSWSEYRGSVGRLPRAFRVIGTGHPRAIDEMAPDYARVGIPVVPDWREVLQRADVLVCDTNSALYEFASTGRPVVVVNGAHFRRDRNHGLRFDWGVGTNVGVQCDHPDRLVAAVDRALELRPGDVAARERALDLVYSFRTGAAERAAAAIEEWILTPAAP